MSHELISTWVRCNHQWQWQQSYHKYTISMWISLHFQKRESAHQPNVIMAIKYNVCNRHDEIYIEILNEQMGSSFWANFKWASIATFNFFSLLNTIFLLEATNHNHLSYFFLLWNFFSSDLLSGNLIRFFFLFNFTCA